MTGHVRRPARIDAESEHRSREPLAVGAGPAEG